MRIFDLPGLIVCKTEKRQSPKLVSNKRNFVRFQIVNVSALQDALGSLQLHGGGAHGLRVGFQTGDGTVARGPRERPQRNARDIHPVCSDESQPGLVDAYDHKVQVCGYLIIKIICCCG